MNWQLIRVESQKFLRWYALSLGITLAIVIIPEEPLTRYNPRVGILAAVQGSLVAWSLFSDPGGSASFLWSRPITRRALFLHRWLFGLACLGLMWFALFVVITSGFRGWVYELTGSIYPPAFRWYELNALWPAVLFSLLAFQLTVFLNVRDNLLSGSGGALRDTVIRVASLMAIGGGIPAGLATVPVGFGGLPPWTPLEALLYVAITAILTSAGALWAYRHMEVES